MLSFSLLFLTIAFAGYVTCDDLFGMKLTTEKTKTKENTQYLFRYYIKDDTTGDYKTQEETREGDSVRGSYTLADPNGDLRTVTYQAGPGRGFEATVNVQPNKSPMKQILEPTTASISIPTKNIPTSELAKGERITTLDSTVKHIPGGFIMDILSKPQSETKTEVGMKFSMNPNNITETITESSVTNTTTVFENKTTEKSEATLTTVEEPIKTSVDELTSENIIASEIENSTFPTEGREITEDPVEKEINDAMNFMPKLPEFVLADNVTLKFHKDPEEALLDERITQIARQLAETSLRREYEERKLGHFIPISVRPIEQSTSGYLSKSLKFTGNDVSQFRPSETAPLQVLTQVRVVPQYIYKETIIPKFSPLHHRLPGISKPIIKTENLQESTYKTITNSPETPIAKSDSPTKEINRILEAQNANYESTHRFPYSFVPIQVPTFLQFFSPVQRYMMQTQRTFATENKPEIFVSQLSQDLTTGTNPVHDKTTFYAHVSSENEGNDGK